MTIHQHNRRRGFTLIEVLVSLSIFTIVVTISVSALYALIDANARARNAQTVATNLSFMLDSMTREIRTGTDYFCSNKTVDDGTPPGLPSLSRQRDRAQDCANGFGIGMAFNEGGQSLTGGGTADVSHRIGYWLKDGRIERRLGTGNWSPITDENVTIEELRFIVKGSERGDAEAPTVTVYIKGYVEEGVTGKNEFDIQTTITQRLLDIE